MVSVLKLKQRSPARERLAVAQNQLVGLAREGELAYRTLARATDLRDQCQRRLTEAETAAQAARESHSASMVKSAETGAAVAISVAVREAQHAEADARHDLAAAESALAVIRERTVAPVAAVRDAQRKVAEGVSDVIGDYAEKALAEADQALVALNRARLTCVVMGNLMSDEHSARRQMSEAVYFDRPGLAADRAAIEARWRGAFDALVANADAELPASSNERGAA